MGGSQILALPSIIATKRDGGCLDDDTIRAVIAGVASGQIPDYQTAALLMAIVFQGLDDRELMTWTKAMISSGECLDLSDIPGPKVDKHSTGGVGDKLTLPLAPLVAACGVNAPLITGRALGHTGGTMDKMESIPGLRTQLPVARLRRVLEKAGFFIAGQTPTLVPADRSLYALRDATATVESIPLIAASIVSKKVASGSDALVMDVKVGRGAFLPTRKSARALARAIVSLAKRLGLPARAVLTDMDQPLGLTIGNALEVEESIQILRDQGPPDSRDLTLKLGVQMLLMGGVVRSEAAALVRLQSALRSGAALERFLLGVRLQGGDVKALEGGRLPRARRQHILRSPRAGFVTDLNPRALGDAATRVGAGRLRKDDVVDPGVGIILHARRGDEVSKHVPLATLWYNDSARMAAALPFLERAFQIGPVRPRACPLVIESLT